VKRKMLEMLEMVNLEPFKALNLTVSFTSDEMHHVARGLGERFSAASCETRALETFAGVEKDMTSSKCFICEYELDPDQDGDSESGEGQGDAAVVGCYRDGCEMCCHSACLMDHFRSTRDQEEGQEDEMGGECPACQELLRWSLLTQHHGLEKASKKRKRAARKQRKKKPRVASVDEEGAERSLPQGVGVPTSTARDDVPVSAADVEYNSDGWFEDDREEEDGRKALENREPSERSRTWRSTSRPNVLGVQLPRTDVEMIDLTED
jgi:hypothetical protein